MDSLENTDILNYDGTDKDKLLFVMELYAWTKILDQQLIELPIFKGSFKKLVNLLYTFYLHKYILYNCFVIKYFIKTHLNHKH